MSCSFKAQPARGGFSIIEVLTSIVVAMIGVFGVMILIPFAVKQAQTGLDSDAAVTAARNANSQFEIRGYHNPTNWITATGNYDPFDLTTPALPEIFSIDPLGVMENGGNLVQANFPFNRLDAGTPFPVNAGTGNDLTFRAVNLRLPNGGQMNAQMARQMFRAADDLVFGESIDDLEGPAAIYDEAEGLILKRQSRGGISWSAIVIPVKIEPAIVTTTRWSYRMYVLVYKNRKTSLADPEGGMRTAMLNPTLNVGFKSPVGNVFLEAGVPVEGALKRDDWVMLINRTKNETDDGPAPAGVVYAEKGFDRNVAFYRVVGLSNPVGTVGASVTLDGPDFNFGDPAGTDAAIDPDGLIEQTYIVHLKDVLGVYERTFAPEFESNWNISN